MYILLLCWLLVLLKRIRLPRRIDTCFVVGAWGPRAVPIVCNAFRYHCAFAPKPLNGLSVHVSILYKHARNWIMGYCGTSIKHPFVLTPPGSCQLWIFSMFRAQLCDMCSAWDSYKLISLSNEDYRTAKHKSIVIWFTVSFGKELPLIGVSSREHAADTLSHNVLQTLFVYISMLTSNNTNTTTMTKRNT